MSVPHWHEPVHLCLTSRRTTLAFALCPANFATSQPLEFENHVSTLRLWQHGAQRSPFGTFIRLLAGEIFVQTKWRSWSLHGFSRKAVQTEYSLESWNMPFPGNAMEFITCPQNIAEASPDVYSQSLQDNLNETFYTASKAKLHCRFSDTTYGLSLSAGGFSQKLLQLVETMIHGLWLKSLSKDRFHSQWEELCRSYRNAWLKPQAGLTCWLVEITRSGKRFEDLRTTLDR